MIVVALAVVPAALLLVANTAPGRHGLERIAAAAVPGLVIEGLAGPLPGRIAARRVTMADAEGVWLELVDLDLRLDWLALARRTARVERLAASRLVLHRLPASEPAVEEPGTGEILPSLPSLPLPVELDALSLAELVLAEPVLGVAARLSVEGSGRLRAQDATARIALRRLDAPGDAGLVLDWRPATGHLSASLTLDEPAGGLAATLLGLADAPAHLALSLDGPVENAPFRLDARLGAAAQASATGTVGIAPDGTTTLSLTANATAPGLLPAPVAEMALTAGLRIAPDGGIVITEATAKTPAADVTLSGTLAASGALAVAWRASTGPQAMALLPPGPRFSGAEGSGRVTGTLAAPVVEANLRVADPRSGIAAVEPLLGAAATLEMRATMAGATGTVAGGAAQAHFDVTWDPELAGRVGVTLPDLSVLGPGFSGAMRANASLAGGITEGVATLDASGDGVTWTHTRLDTPRLTARLRLAGGRPAEVHADGTATYGTMPLTLRVQAAPEGDLIRIAAVRASAGDAVLEGSGSIDPASLLAEGTARLAVPDIAALVPGAPPGRIAATLEASLPEGRQHLALRTEASLRDGTTATASAIGGLDVLALEARANGAGLRASMQGTARVQDRVLDLAALEILRADTPPLRLLRPARLRAGEDGPVLEGLQLGFGSGRIEAAGNLLRRVEVTLRALPIDSLAPATGRIDGTITVEGAERARFQVAATGLGSPMAAGLPPASLRIEGDATATGANLRGTAEAGAAGRFDLTARLSGFGGNDALEGTLRGTMDAARLAAPFIGGGADRVAGRIAVDMRVGGTLGDPRPEGTATLSAGSWRNASMGGALSDIAGRLRFAGTTLHVESLTAKTAGNGSFALDGTVEPFQAGVPVALRLVARNARPITGPFGTGIFDADLALDGPLLGAADLTGRVLVQRADLRVPDSLPASVPQLPGVRARGTRPPGAAPLPQPRPPGGGGPDWALAVQLDAPQRVLIAGRGLDVELGGSLTLRGTLAAPQTDGELTLRRGTVSLPTRRLAFQRGTLKFLGDPIPEVNLVAGAETGGYSVAIEVTGPATSPRIAVTSNPTLPPEEAMALLLFGRSGQRLSATEAVQAAQALAQLSGLPGFADGGVLGRLGRSLGLDRLGVGTSESGAAGVDAGRYIAPGLYLGIRPGTDGTLPGVAAQWDLTPRLRLEAETSRGAGGERVGLAYELEY
ncbi:translocation/assembly module TamB domain-containing protein [Humitalea sp. 24SJ18S-53]|uniref:translocation/assembly module TamB domain-containing protein n=1 Tax=Humitalea sp. 24SJ18S-53 TaxID=3422307 RepID=UPI003D67ED96